MQNLFFFSRARVFARIFTGTLLLMISVVSSVLLLAATGSSTAYAARGGASFSLQPVTYDPKNPATQSYFIFDSKPGIIIKNRVRVTNSGTAKGTVGLYAVDATTGQTSGAVYLNRDDPRQDVGAWVTLGVQQLTLTPGQSKIVPFQVTIPGTIRPGQHLGGIVAENLTQQSSAQTNKNSTFQINVKSLTIVAVQVNLPGTPVEQMAASGVQAGGQNGYQQLLLGLSNTGTVMLKPSGSLQVSDAQGQVLKKIALKLDTFLPQTSIKYPVTITGQGLGPGNYQALLTLMYGQGQVLHYTTPFTISQQQVTQVFGTTASQTQAPPGLPGGNLFGVPSWVLILAGGGLVLLLLLGGNILFLRHAASRGKGKLAPARPRQFKKPLIR
jgi:hypothetical protein